MKAFTFAEISLHRRCFRVARVISKTETDARKRVPGGDWAWGFLGEEESRASEPSVRTELFRERSEFAKLCSKFGLTVEQVEKRIGDATTPGYNILKDGRWEAIKP